VIDHAIVGLMPLTEWQRRWCLQVMDRIRAKPISGPFQRESSRELGLSANIEHYLDLDSIGEQLEDGRYHTVQDWICDVRYIWAAAQRLFREGTPVHAMAADLSTWFERKFAEFPRCLAEQWLADFRSTRGKLRALVDSYPDRRIEPPAPVREIGPIQRRSSPGPIETISPPPPERTPSPPRIVGHVTSSGQYRSIVAHDPRTQKTEKRAVADPFDLMAKPKPTPNRGPC
jgi:hypothetical protein